MVSLAQSANKQVIHQLQISMLTAAVAILQTSFSWYVISYNRMVVWTAAAEW
jgi:hypothetical protein